MGVRVGYRCGVRVLVMGMGASVYIYIYIHNRFYEHDSMNYKNLSFDNDRTKN